MFSFAGHGNAQSPQTFTTNGTFTVPAGVTSITVECWGAGGGGSSISTSGAQGGGGGGGAFASSSVAVLPGNSYTIVVGAAGTASNAGGNSSFNGAAIVAAGGNGGTNNSSTGGLGGTILASTGTTKYAGGNGANGGTTDSGGGGGGAGNGGDGGNASGLTAGIAGSGTGGGAGGTGVSGSSDGNSGNNFGGGGSGAVTNSATIRTGGTGASGQVIVSWICPTDAGVLAGTQNICIAGGTTTLTSTVSGGTWTGGDPSIATIHPATGLVTAIAGGGGGTVTMTYDVSSPGCTVTPVTRIVTVYTLPTVGIGAVMPDVCQGGTSVALGGSTSGGATSAVWSDGAAGGSFSNNGGSTPSTTTWTPLPGYTGTATLTLTTTGGACAQASDSKPITVNASPTLTGASQAATVCAGSSAIINLTGLLTSSTSTVDYKINGVAQTAVSGVLANGSGTASFTSAALTAANNGQILQITGITTTSTTPNCNKTFTQDVTLMVDPTSIGGTVSSDQTICFGSSPADLILSGNTGAVIRWEKSSDALFTAPVTITGTSTTLTGATIGNLTANTWFRAVVQSGACSSANSGFVLVTVTPTVIINAFSPATSIRCQGSGTVTTTTTASNSTGITYSLDAASLAGGNTIVAATGAVTYSAGWSGTTTITASATGSDGPATAIHTVTVNPSSITSAITHQ
ncbi:MAG: hypothetical protein Q8N05_10950, partial [Bacteroidota bacterium]|nr:hypothetical protein [Bacteroidota bacterium]